MIKQWIKEVPSHRGRRALRGCMAIFMNDDIANTFKGIVFGANTTNITMSGAFTTGISIAADGTTAIEVTAAFTGTTGILLAGTGTTGLNITGAHTTGISITGATTNGISITSATASEDILITKTSTATTGAIRSMTITQTMSTTATASQVEALKVALVANAKTGAWAQAIFAQTDYMTNGLAHGVGSVICAELSLPASSVVRGTYYVWQSEIDCPTNCVMNANPIGVMSVSVWGGAKTQFDDVGLLFDISGVTSGAGKFWYDNTDGAYDEWLKIRTPSGVRYIPLMDGQAA